MGSTVACLEFFILAQFDEQRASVFHDAIFAYTLNLVTSFISILDQPMKYWYFD